MHRHDWTHGDSGLLGAGFPLPGDAPFARGAARLAGVTDRDLAALVRDGLLRRVLQGVYTVSQAPDSVASRVAALKLVLAPNTVVVDRTAGWLHGMPVLRRGSHLVVPPLDLATVTDTRVRRSGTDGHRRQLSRQDVMILDGVPVTTPLRTACDLGRLLWRYDALAAIDSALRLGVRHDELIRESLRFKGFRGVRQLRALLPLGDGRSESPGESALRLHWLDAGLPPPKPQHWVPDGGVRQRYRLDVAAPEVRYAAEYDGEEFHSAPEDREHDRERRDWLRNEAGWRVDVFEKDDVYGSTTRILDKLWDGFCAARAAIGGWDP